ncbi:MAG: HPP family protein [Nitrospiria bacterium]
MREIDYMTGGEDFQHMLAAHFMQTNVYYFPQDTPGDKLATAVTMGELGSLPIVDRSNKLVGIISEFDLLNAIISGKELKEVSAQDVMTSQPISVFDYTPLEEVIHVLQSKRLIRVPVTNKQGKLVGVVSRTDILLGYLKSKELPLPWWS